LHVAFRRVTAEEKRCVISGAGHARLRSNSSRSEASQAVLAHDTKKTVVVEDYIKVFHDIQLPDGVGCLYGGERCSSVKLQRPDVEVDTVKLTLDSPSKTTKDLPVPSPDLQSHYLRYAR
jgi:hypothetical protein